MKEYYEDNNKRIDLLQSQIAQLKGMGDMAYTIAGQMQEELQLIQSQNLIMAEEMKAGKNIN